MRLRSGSTVGTASKVTKLLFYLLWGIAEMGVVTTAQNRPPVVRVDGGQLHGVAEDAFLAYFESADLAFQEHLPRARV